MLSFHSVLRVDSLAATAILARMVGTVRHARNARRLKTAVLPGAPP